MNGGIKFHIGNLKHTTRHLRDFLLEMEDWITKSHLAFKNFWQAGKETILELSNHEIEYQLLSPIWQSLQERVLPSHHVLN